MPAKRKKTPAQPRRKAPSGGATARRLYILSDSTGNLARHMLGAFLTQFPRDTFSLNMRVFLNRPRKLEEALREIEATPGIVFHAVVSQASKLLIEQRCAQIGVPARDLTGRFVKFLQEQSGIEPLADSQRLHDVDDAYYRRIEAVEFALQHDDGLGLETLGEADVVLAGISRTGKTPTTMYLAQQGHFAGNVALAMQVQPPRQLLELPARKVVGLTIDVPQLVEIRTRRQQDWKMGETGYNQAEAVEQEIAWSRSLFRSKGWQVLNVTDQAIEETAGRIVALAGLVHH